MSERTLKFVADESCDFAVVRDLRKAGFDVLAIAEATPGAPDTEVLRTSSLEGLILLTEDKDFGEWVFAHGEPTRGVVLIRFPAKMRQGMVKAVTELVTEHGSELQGAFAVLEPGRVRIRSI